MFEWLYNWLFPARPEYKPNIVGELLMQRGYTYDEAVKFVYIYNEEYNTHYRLPAVEELQYLAKNNLVGDLFTSAWCKDNYNDVYAYVVYADGSRKKCDKNEFHQVVLVKDL